METNVHQISSCPAPQILCADTDTIDQPLVPPAKRDVWAIGDIWSIFIEHASGKRMLVIGSVGFEPDSLNGRKVDTVFLAIGGLSRQSKDYREQWWNENVKRVCARRVVPIHWDDPGLRVQDSLVAYPYLLGNIGATMAEISDWSKRDGIELSLPPQFTPFSP